MLCYVRRKLFGQDSELADAAGEFSFRLIPGLFPYYLFKVLTKYLQTQNILAPSVWIGVFANGANVLFNWGLIYAADWGLAGAPWATTLTRFLELVLIVIYMMIKESSLKDTWPVLSTKNLTGDVLKPFLKLAISGECIPLILQLEIMMCYLTRCISPVYRCNELFSRGVVV